MPIWLISTAKWGSVLALIAIVIAFFKSIIAFIASLMAFIGFLTWAIKIVIVVVFVALLVGVAYMVFKSFSSKRKSES
jgi:hypothetical protein